MISRTVNGHGDGVAGNGEGRGASGSVASCGTTRLVRALREISACSCQYRVNTEDAQKDRAHSPSFVNRRSALIRRKALMPYSPSRMAGNREWTALLSTLRHQPYALPSTRSASRFTPYGCRAHGRRIFSASCQSGLFMNAVARHSRRKPDEAARTSGRRRRTGSPSRRPNENSLAGRWDRTPEQVSMTSPG